MRMNLLGGASRYAHLAGLVPARGARAEDEDKKDGKKSRRAADDDDDQDDEPKGKKSKAGDPEQYPDEDDSQPKGKKSRRAEDEDEDDEPKGKKSRAADEDEDEDEPKGKRSKARADDDEDEDPDAEDDKDEMTGRSASARARRRERARCKAIFSHPAAASNLALAASLAFDTTQTRKEALAVLKSQAGRGGAAHDVRVDRARRNPDLGPGGQGGPTEKQATAASWSRALDKAGVPTRK